MRHCLGFVVRYTFAARTLSVSIGRQRTDLKYSGNLSLAAQHGLDMLLLILRILAEFRLLAIQYTEAKLVTSGRFP